MDESTNLVIHNNAALGMTEHLDSQFNHDMNRWREYKSKQFIGEETTYNITPTIDEEPYESDYLPVINTAKSPTFYSGLLTPVDEYNR